ncbi:hypothetical protein BDU57DRAFT_594337 [Ampelomyces quisqualis]|uniref:Peptidase M20 dimerisation domain-containing protein n=1 Tax=Ampelomyces quisqualis TaxID=50730 RepID=A0A6A5QUD1_AMPQU|nr:hypothetical protein BDU57DRAFT_594337 [Ampelomyces quisqualis]
MLQQTCSQWGASSSGSGMCRLALIPEDKEVRDWLVAECKSLGFNVKIDRFSGAMMASVVWSQKSSTPLEACWDIGNTPCEYHENGLECHFKLHIDEKGREGHSGTTPMPGRADALVTASRLITGVRDAVVTELGAATVGVISSDTSSQATVPAGVDFVMVEQLSFAAFDKIVSQEDYGT